MRWGERLKPKVTSSVIRRSLKPSLRTLWETTYASHTITLHALIGKKINKERPDICFNEEDHIRTVSFPDPNDERRRPTVTTELMDTPMSVVIGAVGENKKIDVWMRSTQPW